MPDKVIATNESALRQKYNAAGLRAVKAAVARLIAADKTRGLVTRYVAIDNATTMKKLGGLPVTSVQNCRQNKEAIDSVWKSLKPDYLMILGATDVVPHQDMRNPVNAAGDDPDVVAFSDLPYACDTPYSRDVAKCIGPTRVVSRLPDMTGADEPGHLLAVLATAAAWKQWPASDQSRYFGLSAQEWRRSTELSLTNVFGSHPSLTLSPPSGPAFPSKVIGAPSHFINCHGGDVDPNFYGQKGNAYPVALSSPGIAKMIATGTIAAVECCYGAQLYAPGALRLPMPICQTYLAQGAYAYFGSTTIAYGPADGNGAADLIAQYFLLKVLEGSSVGMATLAARQEFVAQTGQMDPVDLKTLAQFCVYGDPSIHPVLIATPTGVPKGTHAGVVESLDRRERRAKLALSGRSLQEQKPTAAVPQRRHAISPQVRAVLSGLSREAGVPSASFVAFAVKAKGGARSGKAVTDANRYHVLVARIRQRRGQVVQRVAIVAKEAARRVVGYRVYFTR
jgi:hypothetical protein